MNKKTSAFLEPKGDFVNIIYSVAHVCINVLSTTGNLYNNSAHFCAVYGTRSNKRYRCSATMYKRKYGVLKKKSNVTAR